MSSRGLAGVPLCRITTDAGRCANCPHGRASHGQRARRCWSRGCKCPGWQAADVAP